MYIEMSTLYKAYLKTGINVNASTSWTAYDIFGSGYSEEINQGGFTLANSNLVAPETGYYRLSFNIYLYSTGSRTNVGVKPVVEGTELNEISASDYIRNVGGHNEASTAMSTIVYLSGNKEVNLKFARLTDETTSVTVQSGSFITLEKIKGPTITTTTTTGGLAGSTAVPDETTTDAPSVTLDATDTTVTDPTLDLDFTTTLPRTLKRYNGVTNSSIGARFNRRETYKKRIEKSINISTRFSAELTANNASSPTTLTVTVANSKFVINGDETPTLGFIRGETYTFDQSDVSNSGHPLVLATSEDGATQYTTGWTASGTPGTDGSHAFIVPYNVPDTIYYKCTNHANMGGEINTTFGNVFSLGDFTVVANTHVSGEYTLATNYDGTTSNLYVNNELISQTTPSPAISAGVKEFILGKEFDGYVKNFKFWNYAKRFFVPILIAFHYGSFDTVYGDVDVTEAANNGHIFDDTPSGTYTWGTLGTPSTASNQTTYTWTPALTVIAKVLMVAGGGGGAPSDNNNGGGGGGGAGGVVYNASVSLSGQQTITVGGSNSTLNSEGLNTAFSGLTTAIGGGKGGGPGGSGGGAYRNGTGGSGTEGQGYAGGNGSSTYSPSNDQGGSGGGGAGGAGVGAIDANGANGGVGLDYSSVFGTTYGDSGWFASGGAGGFHSGSPGTASNGGGGDGGSSGGSAGTNGQNHTGGGGGGGSIPSGGGSYGGSGIVLIKY